LVALINEFLEEQVEKGDLLANPSMIAHYRQLLDDNLPPRDIEAAKYEWRAEAKKSLKGMGKSKKI